jgi:D-xylose transport system permease protein
MTVNLPTDQQDERLAINRGIRGIGRQFLDRVRDGDIGSLPVIIGLVIIWAIFQALNPNFLSSANLVNLTMQCAAVGTISIGIVVTLLVGQIDLSVGSVSGLSAAILAVATLRLPVTDDLSLSMSILIQGLIILGSILVGSVIGFIYGILFTRFGVPSFLITLAGLLAFLGLQLFVLGRDGSISISTNLGITYFAQQLFLPEWAAYTLAVVAIGTTVLFQLSLARRRSDAGLSFTPRSTILGRAGLIVVALCFTAWLLYRDFGPSGVQGRGVSLMFLFFLLLVTVVHLALTRTSWGRSVFAVGGNVEGARRAGIRVPRVYISVFILCSTLAAIGGLLAAARGLSANQSSGGGDTNLNAIAAAVIGGTSLFGGRGSAFSALLGIVVIMSISSGLTLLSLDSSVRFMITGAVLLLAVIIDSMSRRKRVTSGRG